MKELAVSPPTKWNLFIKKAATMIAITVLIVVLEAVVIYGIIAEFKLEFL